MMYALLLFLAGAAAQTCPIGGGTCKLVWNDEFSGNTLDMSKWSYQIGRGCELPAGCGWGNGEQESYTSSNAVVSDGTLKIVAKPDLTSSRIRTMGKFSKTYGIFEARMKLPNFTGAWPAFWMMPESDAYGGWAASGESDSMEAKNECSVVQSTLHFGGAWPNQKDSDQCKAPCLSSVAPGWHTFRLVWRPKGMRWFVDGVQTCWRNDWWSDSAPNVDGPPFDKPFHIILNLALGGGYPGKAVDASQLPQQLEVDYVRVWDLA
jgi:beta-glucanase (GH16 family)